jgi:hypothetical protein
MSNVPPILSRAKTPTTLCRLNARLRLHSTAEMRGRLAKLARHFRGRAGCASGPQASRLNWKPIRSLIRRLPRANYFSPACAKCSTIGSGKRAARGSVVSIEPIGSRATHWGRERASFSQAGNSPSWRGLRAIWHRHATFTRDAAARIVPRRRGWREIRHRRRRRTELLEDEDGIFGRDKPEHAARVGINDRRGAGQHQRAVGRH